MVFHIVQKNICDTSTSVNPNTALEQSAFVALWCSQLYDNNYQAYCILNGVVLATILNQVTNVESIIIAKQMRGGDEFTLTEYTLAHINMKRHK